MKKNYREILESVENVRNTNGQELKESNTDRVSVLKYCVNILSNYYSRGLIRQDFYLDKLDHKDSYVLHIGESILAFSGLEKLEGFCCGIQSVTSIDDSCDNVPSKYFSENLRKEILNEQY